ncbi:uncharacterized protein LOC9637487 isoform X2 [Selaginella moellendorffii]|uniref:uncharacterized protein LOC9637487 isoform X2 n=1 Tax=Selaginella moellendorffii TaxID=88036 RepID=UPI000D1CC839|nr:uncharacterized protein LOC9637487 isoform X2 [Selaginella moellendorffii]|eukprot:XP_024533592.1 uncharacterized protein LOC9637487 isoform X2 [Selaginella moellendorffii]
MGDLFRINGTGVTLSQVLEFLGSIPSFQQLPITAIERLALAVQPKECSFFFSTIRAFKSSSRSLHCLEWRGNSSVKILSRGGFVTQEELQGATASGKVVFLVLNSADAALIHTKHIWTPGGTSVIEKLLQLEKVEIDVYRGFSNPNLVEFKQIFGGQLVGQALAAASKSVNPFFLVHSLHSYFLFPGDKSIPIIYRVQRIRDGYNFANRSVSAFQSDQIIFTMTASFRRGESGAEHQLPVPCVPPPEELEREEIAQQRYLSDPRLSLSKKELLKNNSSKEHPLDLRRCEDFDEVDPEPCESRLALWFRAKGTLPDDQALHRCILAYASDWIFLESALRPHGWTSGPTGIFTDIKVLSMDHSLWFHTSVKATDWHLFSVLQIYFLRVFTVSHCRWRVPVPHQVEHLSLAIFTRDKESWWFPQHRKASSERSWNLGCDKMVSVIASSHALYKRSSLRKVPSTPCGEQSFTPLYQPPKLTKVFILNITPA